MARSHVFPRHTCPHLAPYLLSQPWGCLWSQSKVLKRNPPPYLDTPTYRTVYLSNILFALVLCETWTAWPKWTNQTLVSLQQVYLSLGCCRHVISLSRSTHIYSLMWSGTEQTTWKGKSTGLRSAFLVCFLLVSLFRGIRHRKKGRVALQPHLANYKTV